MPTVATVGGPVGDMYVDCSWATCSIYYSRAKTRWAQKTLNGAIAGGVTAATAGICALVNPAAAIACAGAMETYQTAMKNATNRAVGINGCLRARVLRNGMPISFHATNQAPYCRN